MRIRVLLASAAVTLFGVAARADIQIDSFTQPNPAAEYSLGTGAPAEFTRTEGIAPTNGVATTRTLLVRQIANNGTGGSTPTEGRIGLTPGGPRFVMDVNTGATSFASLTYNYGSDLDISTGTDLQFTITFLDQEAPFALRITDAAGDSFTVSELAPQTQTGSTFNIGLGAFTANGVDLSQVRSIQILLNNNGGEGGSIESVDVSLTDITVLAPLPPAPVPAPPAVVLLLAAVPALGAVRLIRRKAAAA